MHSYQPTVWDMMKIAEADLFIYVGGESDFWVEDALENTKSPDRKVLNLMELLEDSVKEEEHVDGMQKSRGHEDQEEEEESE
ncbi:MAG TPA: zinc ABC transporter substrate-binding protein, partial [Lachnospiraceae bacterium]|nr:zinc ABC transporter substrate-binding protein [Lachnospiraceae bacterium]